MGIPIEFIVKWIDQYVACYAIGMVMLTRRPMSRKTTTMNNI